METYDHGGVKVKPFQASADGLGMEAEVINRTTKVDFLAISAYHDVLDFLSSDNLGEIL
jgi:hypothetical protein